MALICKRLPEAHSEFMNNCISAQFEASLSRTWQPLRPSKASGRAEAVEAAEAAEVASSNSTPTHSLRVRVRVRAPRDTDVATCRAELQRVHARFVAPWRSASVRWVVVIESRVDRTTGSASVMHAALLDDICGLGLSIGPHKMPGACEPTLRALQSYGASLLALDLRQTSKLRSVDGLGTLTMLERLRLNDCKRPRGRDLAHKLHKPAVVASRPHNRTGPSKPVGTPLVTRRGGCCAARLRDGEAACVCQGRTKWI